MKSLLARAGSESELVFSKPRPKGMARLPVSWMLLFNPKQPRCELRSLQCERENRPVSSSVDLSYLNPCLLVQCASRKLCRGKGPQSSNNNDKSGGPTARLSLGRPCCLHDPSCNCALLVHEAARPEARSPKPSQEEPGQETPESFSPSKGRGAQRLLGPFGACWV